MTAKLRSWWQKIKTYRVVIGIVAIVLAVIVALIIIGYQFDWTGFNGYNKVTKTTDITSSPPKITITEEYQPGKALWDWLNLLGVFAIPAVVGLGAAWYTAQQGKVSDRENTDNQRETALQQYIDKISELLLEKHLRESQRQDEVQTIARVRTLTTLPRLDETRKASLIKFLWESQLITIDHKIIDLEGADLTNANLSGAILRGGVYLYGANLTNANLSEAILSGVYLYGANLTNANLSGATLNVFYGHNKDGVLVPKEVVNLTNANLSGADLMGADLSKAILKGAKVTEEQLKKAKSLEGATMPDGSRHP